MRPASDGRLCGQEDYFSASRVVGPCLAAQDGLLEVRRPVMESAVDGRSRRGLLAGCLRILLVMVALAASWVLLSGQAAASPLLGIILTLGVLLLVLAFGMGIHARDWVPKGLRERLSALWEPSPLYAAADALRRAPTGSVSTAPAGAKRSRGADVAKKPSSPAKAKRLPSPKKPPGKPAKPAGAVKPQRLSKPARSAKPSEVAKSPRALKLTKPAPSAKPRPPARVKPPTKASTRRRTRSPGHRAELRPVDERSPLVADPAPTERAVTCSIFGWRDGEVADFYAVAFGLQGHDWIVERSPRFLWPAGDVPAEAYEAHAALVDALVRAGWRPTGYEGAWYRQRFEHPIEPVSERP